MAIHRTVKLGSVVATVFALGAGVQAQNAGSVLQDGHMGGRCSQCHVARSNTRYEFDPTHSTVIYSVDAYGFKAVGLFAEIAGGFVFDASDPEGGSVLANIEARSLSMQNSALDSLIRSERFLDAARYPAVSFRSVSVEKTADDTLRVNGIVSMRGIERAASLEVEVNGSGRHPLTGRQTAGFVARGRLLRSEFGMTLGLPAISDEVEFTVYAQGNLLN